MPRVAPLPVHRLHATLDDSRLPWQDSDQIPVRKYLRSGRSPFQPRAMESLDLALNIPSAGYHVYLSGEPNLGRSHMLLSYLEPVAARGATPPDLVHLHNFNEPDSPLIFSLPPGLGRELRASMKDLLQDIARDLEQRAEAVSFTRKRSRLTDNFQDLRSDLIRKMSKVAHAQGFHIDMDQEGAIALFPMAGGKKLSEEDFSKLEPQQKLDYRALGDKVAKNLSGYLRKLSRAEEKLHEEERSLDVEAMEQTLEALLTPVEKRFCAACAALAPWFRALRADILKNTDSFIDPDYHKEDARGEAWLQRYAVNLFVDNSALKGLPVILEDNPTPANLLGTIERESEMGALVTDLTLIRAGSLQKANGGFLVLYAGDLLSHPTAWEGIMRSLRKNEARIEDLGESPEAIHARSLRPQPLALNVKVILIGSEDMYEALLDYDERFSRLFRIKAHMTDTTERTAANIKLFLAHMAHIIRQEELLPFNAKALAWLVDLGSHLCEDQKRLSLKFPLLRELMIEANALARMDRADFVNSEILEQAYAMQARRANLIEEEFVEEYDREIIKVSTSGSAIGQVNGLSVLTQGEYEFGLPHRISCAVGVGHDGIIDLEREAELGGPIHTKAMMILKSYLTSQFASKRPLALTASLHFEQSYGGIEGDSASGAELAALLSALAQVPARHDLAFTGAVSHSGQIMAVGGVTRKIEGFYKVCARHGLTGTQGVIIPADNVDHLMLSPEILESVAREKFAIYPVRSIEEALWLLTGLPAGKRRKDGRFTPGSLYDLVDRRLEDLGYRGQSAFRRRGTAGES